MFSGARIHFFSGTAGRELIKDFPAMDAPLVMLRNGPDMPPLFITHGLGGDVAELAELAEQLGSFRPVYGLQWRGLDGLERPHDSFDNMARYFADAIEKIWPDGPLLLAGLSIGGLPMLEAARILSERGRRVALLLLMDTYPHSKYWPRSSQIAVILQRMRRKAGVLSEMPVNQAIPYAVQLLNKFGGHVISRLKGSEIIPADKTGAGPALRELRVAAFRALVQYRPHFYPGKITFVSAREKTVFPANPAKVWGPMTDDLEIVALPCHHVAMIGEEAQMAADALKRCIQKALTPGAVRQAETV
jgi:thioesterase domain-containing protein